MSSRGHRIRSKSILLRAKKARLQYSLPALDGFLAPVPDSGEFSDIHALEGRSLIASRMTVASPGEVIRASDSQRSIQLEATANEFRQEEQETHLNDALLDQLDLAPLESFWFTAARQDQSPRLPYQAARLRPGEEISASSFSSTAARRAHGATRGAIAGTPNSLPPTATSWS